MPDAEPAGAVPCGPTSPNAPRLHAAAVGLFRFAVLAGAPLIVFFVITAVLAPT